MAAKSNIFLRKIDRDYQYIMHNNEFYEVDQDIVDVLKCCDGQHLISSITSILKLNPVEVKQSIDFLVNEGLVEFCEQYSEYKIEPFVDENYPNSLTVEISYECNMRCRHCIVGDFINTESKLEENIACRIIEEMNKLNIELLTITGGEPLLNYKVLLLLIEMAIKSKIDVALLTNGYGLDEKNIEQLYDSGLRKIQLSLDGGNSKTHDYIRNKPGSFDKVLNCISILKAKGFTEIALAMTVSKLNIKEVVSFLDICDLHHVQPRLAQVVAIQNGGDNNIALSIEQQIEFFKLTHRVSEGRYSATVLPSLGCSVGCSPVINPSGDIYPCMHMKFPDFYLGNIKNDSLKKIWDRSDILKKIKIFSRSDVKKCSKCWNRYLCNSCLGEIFAISGTIHSWNRYRCAANQKISKILIEEGDSDTQESIKKFARF